MKETQYNEIKEHVASIDQYSKEVELIEAFFESKDINIEDATVIFWNHLVTLLERVDEDSQNSSEEEPADKMSEEAQQLTDEFQAYLHNHRPFYLTDFEHYLLTIYFEQYK